MMNRIWLLAIALLHLVPSEATRFTVGGGIGVAVGGGGGGIWVGGGGRTSNTPDPPNNNIPSPNLQEAYTALQAWKSSITEDPLGILTNWVGSDVCSYKGVFCSSDPQQQQENGSGHFVAGIDLNHANLKGSLVNHLSLLTQISILHLNTNRFSGTVPESFKDLWSLQELDLSNNLFSGPFPSVTLYIPNLIYLDLRFNRFSGPIPDELFNRNLDAIFLNNNLFEGQVPQNLGNSPASVINLANNMLSGNIPASTGMMGSKLKEILFLNNKLTGCIPEGIGMFTEMQVFDVSYNSLMGHLPETISCLTEMEVLNLGHNKLSGEVPSDLICSLRSLVNLSLAYNFFNGFSTQECSRRNYYDYGFDFSLNCIPGLGMQRPQPECSVVPGGGVSCFRIPSPQPLVCGSLLGNLEINLTKSSSSSSSSSSPPP